MPDELRTIPPDQIRGDDLCEWHVVECQCQNCDHKRVLPHAPLKQGRRGGLTLAQMHFRCQWCGDTGAPAITVYKLPRNW